MSRRHCLAMARDWIYNKFDSYRTDILIRGIKHSALGSGGPGFKSQFNQVQIESSTGTDAGAATYKGAARRFCQFVKAKRLSK